MSMGTRGQLCIIILLKDKHICLLPNTSKCVCPIHSPLQRRNFEKNSGRNDRHLCTLPFVSLRPSYNMGTESPPTRLSHIQLCKLQTSCFIPVSGCLSISWNTLLISGSLVWLQPTQQCHCVHYGHIQRKLYLSHLFESGVICVPCAHKCSCSQTSCTSFAVQMTLLFMLILELFHKNALYIDYTCQLSLYPVSMEPQ